MSGSDSSRGPAGSPAAPGLHSFSAIAFVENLSLKELAGAFPGARLTPHELQRKLESGADVFVYPFGAVVFRDASRAEREAEIARLRSAQPGLTTETVREDFTVREMPEARPGVVDGALVIDRLTGPRAGVVALVIGQSAAMEYYERIVEDLFARTRALVDRLQSRGDVPLRTRPLHRFIGDSIGTRSEVLSVLHLLDKPDATWEDPEMDRIHRELREEFDLTDRYDALQQKLSSVQEALELILGVARDRRLLWLEAAIVLLILFELLVGLVGRR
jgi:uncharacterized Rmd1/YagE family protein